MLRIFTKKQYIKTSMVQLAVCLNQDHSEITKTSLLRPRQEHDQSLSKMLAAYAYHCLACCEQASKSYWCMDALVIAVIILSNSFQFSNARHGQPQSNSSHYFAGEKDWIKQYLHKVHQILSKKHWNDCCGAIRITSAYSETHSCRSAHKVEFLSHGPWGQPNAALIRQYFPSSRKKFSIPKSSNSSSLQLSNWFSECGITVGSSSL